MQSAGWDSQFWSTPVPDELSAAGSWSLGIGSDPFLSQYRALPAEDRKYDLLVRANYFWESDYRLLVGWVVPYDAQFVIHLKPVSEDMTEVHIFQKNVRIVAWKKFGFSIGHGVLGFHDDFRVVPPSTLETCKMFDLLLVEPEG